MLLKTSICHLCIKNYFQGVFYLSVICIYVCFNDVHAHVNSIGLYNSTEPNGCLSELGLSPWGYKAFVPINSWLRPSPVITKFIPGHDARLLSNAIHGEQEKVPIEFHFSDEMDCTQLLNSLSVESTTTDGSTASIDSGSVSCQVVNSSVSVDKLYAGQITTAWTFSANLVNVSNGVHSITMKNVTAKAGNYSTNVMLSDLICGCIQTDYDIGHRPLFLTHWS